MIALAVLALTTSLSASTLQGRVEDHTGGSIAGATIVVACTGDGRNATSDASGRFEVAGLAAGHCTVAASHEHFTSTFIEVILPADGVVTARLVLPVQSLAEDVVVTPARGGREAAAGVPSGMSVVGERELALRPYQVLPQALREEPGIAVQQTTAAGGSPIIRGYTGQGNVYLVDGVRLNTSAWRSGPSQYMTWLSPGAVERIEVVRGPMSVQYGSDALGGVVHVLQSRPPFSAAGRHVKGAVEGQFGSADSSTGANVAVTLQSPSIAVSVAGSIKHVGDLRSGGGKDSRAAVTRFLGIPSSALSDRLVGTGYDQWGAQVSAQARAGRAGLFSTFVRHDEQTGVSRYDRIAGGEGLYRSEIVPQRLDLAVLRYERASLRFVDGLRASVSFNRQQDGTLEQARPTARIESERTRVTVIGYQAQASRAFHGHSTSFGGEVYDERIDADRWQAAGGVRTAIRPLIPDGTSYTSAGLFAQAASAEFAGRISLRGGVRYNAYRYRSRENTEFAIHPERIDTHALTFSSSAAIALGRSLRATLSASRGFRAANASDLGAIGVSGGGGFEISPAAAAGLGAIIGSTDGVDAVATPKKAGALGPESEYAFEAGLRFSSRRVTLSATAFDLELYDAIQRRALIFESPVVGTVISGQEIVRQDSAGRAFIAIDPRPIGTRVNASRARVAGVDVEGTARVGSRWTARTYFSMSNGRDLETDAYLRRMAPPMGGVAIGWQPWQQRMRIEGSLTFARAQTRLSPADLSDARIGGRRTAATIASFFNGTAGDLGLTLGGALLATGESLTQVQARLLNGAGASMIYTEEPGWIAFGARALIPLHAGLDLMVIGENLTDRNYRVIGSGVDAPGANAQIRVRVKF